MSNTPSIPEKLEKPLLEVAATGMNPREIAAWLESAHGVKVSHVTVWRFLAKTKSERADIAKVVLREKLSTTLTADIDRLEWWASALDKEAKKALKKKDRPGVKILVAELRKLTEVKLRYSGAAETDDATTAISTAAERVKTKLARLSDPEPEPTEASSGGDRGPVPG